MFDHDHDRELYPDADFAALAAAAFKGELAAGRRLAERSGLTPADALRATLRARAGSAGLDQLLAERAAERLRGAQQAAVRHARAAASASRRLASAPAPAWRAWFDGSAHPNPGRCTIGAVLEGPGSVLVEISRACGYGNSSEAEYLALLALLEAALEHGAGALAIHGDSQVVIDDVNAPDCASAPSLRSHRARARALLARLPGATLRWIPRHKNTRADALSQAAVFLPSTDQPDEPGT
ncbi:reverse transcriptase-like protein [Massilia sp. H6]|uniref:reverse transcriptase-like protein n=1 Tax=Massilia sp. H6 TaxID=2970464 RepID=UPI002169AE1A|nr:reverse transcriptase-like protein [Massilia sp. H6]UVW26894.1 reverse transcriptase-like protein [Massilia sp. H6]